jgi:hypothetical protein
VINPMGGKAMPFDNLATTLTGDLTDAVRQLGIIPVPNEVLRAHKANELRKHPGSWWYHNQHLGTWLVTMGLLTSVLGFFGCVGLAVVQLSAFHYQSAFIDTGCAAGAAIVFTILVLSDLGTIQGLSVKGPAIWHEHFGLYLLREFNVPPSMADTVWRLRRLAPNAVVVVGELRQQSITIDPYVLLRDENNDVVIGIWDDTGIIHEASYG